MSTRSQVVVTDGYDEIWFYRHSDGYPSGVSKTLLKFVQLVKDKKIRNNAEQAAGWLILLGAVEYQRGFPEWFAEAGRLRKSGKESYMANDKEISKAITEITTDGEGTDFKVGAYEPCPNGAIHGDIEFFYVVDLTVPAAYQVQWDDSGPIYNTKKLLTEVLENN